MRKIPGESTDQYLRFLRWAISSDRAKCPKEGIPWRWEARVEGVPRFTDAGSLLAFIAKEEAFKLLAKTLSAPESVCTLNPRELAYLVAEHKPPEGKRDLSGISDSDLESAKKLLYGKKRKIRE